MEQIGKYPNIQLNLVMSTPFLPVIFWSLSPLTEEDQNQNFSGLKLEKMVWEDWRPDNTIIHLIA
jgi:hypothetical protein